MKGKKKKRTQILSFNLLWKIKYDDNYLKNITFLKSPVSIQRRYLIGKHGRERLLILNLLLLFFYFFQFFFFCMHCLVLRMIGRKKRIYIYIYCFSVWLSMEKLREGKLNFWQMHFSPTFRPFSSKENKTENLLAFFLFFSSIIFFPHLFPRHPNIRKSFLLTFFPFLSTFH